MVKENKIKIALAISYIIIISLFLWAFFNHFSINELTSYDFIKDNRNYLIQFKTSNYFFLITIFTIFTIFWVLLLGFGTPIALLGGFIFGKWIGTLVVAISLSIGATFLYLFSKYFLKDIIEKKFFEKFKYLNEKFKKNEFIFFLIYRFIGGIPFFISNIIPVLFNVKVKNFFFGSILGMLPQLFVYVALGSGFEEIINKNIDTPSFSSIIFSQEIYIPIIGFIFLIIIGIYIKKRFIK